jgi:hypothetical protein
MPDTFKTDTYKGSPTCSVLIGVNGKTGEEYWFTFGVKKAKAILEHVHEIQEFVEEHDDNQQRK